MQPHLPRIYLDSSTGFFNVKPQAKIAICFDETDSGGVQYRFNGFNVSCPWGGVAVSIVSFLLLFLVPFSYVGRFEYFFVYVSLHSA